MLIVGDSEIIAFEWVKDGVSVVTGTADMQVRRNVAGTVEYLQSDETTFSSTVNAFSLTLTGTEWRRTMTIPASAQGENLILNAVHSDSILPPQALTEYVTVNDLDDGGGSSADVTAIKNYLMERRKKINLTTSKEEMYDAAGTAVERTWDLKDKDGAVIDAFSGTFDRTPE